MVERTEIGVWMMLKKRLGVGLMVHHEIDEGHSLIKPMKVVHRVLNCTGIGFYRRSTVGGEDHILQGAER